MISVLGSITLIATVFLPDDLFLAEHRIPVAKLIGQNVPAEIDQIPCADDSDYEPGLSIKKQMKQLLAVISQVHHLDFTTTGC